MARIRTDIAFLDGPQTEGRETASRGFTRTATFLAQQLGAAGLQPVLQGEYRSQYAATIRRVVNHRVELVGRDTTRLIRGEDFLLVDPVASFDARGRSWPPDIPGMIWNDQVTQMEAPSSWRVTYTVDTRATTAPMHVAGMIPGADPLKRDSLVVWMAPADAAGMQGTVGWTDGSDLSIPSAALLAAARQAATWQRSWGAFPHTVFVVFLSGTRDACQGPDMLRRYFPWDTDLISRVVVADMATSTSCGWQEVWKDVSAPLTVLTARGGSESDSDHGFGPYVPRSETQRPEALDVATTEALRLSREYLKRLP